MRNIRGKVAFIAGGANEIGLGIARSFAKAGMRVVIGDCDQDLLAEAMTFLGEAHGHIYPILVDVTDRESVEHAAIETENVFGGIHALVNNAFVRCASSMSTIRDNEWDRLMRINLDGMFNTVHTFIPRIKKHGEGGHIISTSSVLGLFTLGGHYAASCASEFAVVAIMEALRAELTESDIGVSVVCSHAIEPTSPDGLRDAPSVSDPLALGQHVLRGMLRNELYVLTHSEFSGIIQARNDALIASSMNDTHANAERIALAQRFLQRSVYLAERDRHFFASDT